MNKILILSLMLFSSCSTLKESRQTSLKSAPVHVKISDDDDNSGLSDDDDGKELLAIDSIVYTQQ